MCHKLCGSQKIIMFVIGVMFKTWVCWGKLRMVNLNSSLQFNLRLVVTIGCGCEIGLLAY